MHELGLAESILDVVRQYVPPADAPLIQCVTVRVGDAAGVVVESLEFCFQAIVAGTPYSGARLMIDRVPVRSRCLACGEIFPSDPPVVVCPECGDPDVQLESGTELQIVDVELAERDMARG